MPKKQVETRNIQYMNTTVCNWFGVKTTHDAYSSGTVMIAAMTSWNQYVRVQGDYYFQEEAIFESVLVRLHL